MFLSDVIEPGRNGSKATPDHGVSSVVVCPRWGMATQGDVGGAGDPPDDWHPLRVANVFELGTLVQLHRCGAKQRSPRDEFQDRR